MYPRKVTATTLLALICLSSLCGPEVQARDFRGSRFDGSGSGDSDQEIHSLSVAGGVAAPSATGFFGENPAGLIYNRGASLLGYLSTGGGDRNLLGNGIAAMAGNGQAAASIGLQSFNNVSDSGGAITNFTFGMATHAEFMNTTFGLSGSYRFQSPGTGVDPALAPTWSADFGMLYNPFGDFQVGAKLYGLSEGVTAFGLGAAAHINSVSILALDMSTNNHGQGLTLKPGIGVRAASMTLSYSYGMQVEKSAPSGITTGNTLGLGYEFSPQFRIMGFYNHFTPYFLGATIELF